MVKCKICGKRVVPRRTEPKQVKHGLYDPQPMHLYGNPYDGDFDEPERVKIYGCIDPKCYFEMTEHEYYSEKEFEHFLGNSKSVKMGNYDFFISYYSGTGSIFARYLKDHSKDIGGLTAFLDKDDIPKNVTDDMPEWHSFIDQGIKNSKYFILIMTRRFNERLEVIREYWKAIDNKIPIFLFKQNKLKNVDLSSGIGHDPVDFSCMEYIEFSDECDLLSKVDEVLSEEKKKHVNL